MKVPSEGKSRLIDVLTRSSRKLLTIALLKRVLKASIGSCADSVYVIGGGLEVAQVCQQMGVNWLDSNSGDLNFDVSLGIAEINKTGNGTVYLPGDLPFVTPSDIDSVIKLSDNGNFSVFATFAEDVTGDSLSGMIVNNARGTLKCCAIKAPIEKPTKLKLSIFKKLIKLFSCSLKFLKLRFLNPFFVLP